MNHASLFTGIGGFDLAARWMGWNNVFQVEIDEFCHKVLNKNFPETDKHRDIYEFDATQYTGQIDILTGGFPCQPFSTAGKRMGESDDRHLWPEMLRVIREVQPTWVVGENVAGILSMEDGATLERIFTDLEGEGYAVQAFVIPASSVGAIHRRDRVWIVANSSSTRTGMATPNTSRQKRRNSEASQPTILRSRNRSSNAEGVGKFGAYRNAPDTIRDNGGEIQLQREQAIMQSECVGVCENGEVGELLWPTVSPVCRTDDGVPPELDRRKRLKALGNAIVPQVAYEIFRAIEAESFVPGTKQQDK